MMTNRYLLWAGIINGIAALLHLACIAGGETWYRAMGAGEHMAMLAASGSDEPTVITLWISGVFVIWSLVAFSAAGLIVRLPLLRVGLGLITAIYLVRGVAGFYFINMPLGRTTEFWLISSLICLAIGVVHFFGTKQYFQAMLLRNVT